MGWYGFSDSIPSNKTIKNLKLDWGGGGTYLSQNLWPKVFFGSLSSAVGLSETKTQISHMQYWKHQYFLLVMIFNNQTSVLLLSNILYQYGPILTDQALVVVGADNAIHCLNLYLVDSMVIFLHTCPFKLCYLASEQLGHGLKLKSLYK